MSEKRVFIPISGGTDVAETKNLITALRGKVRGLKFHPTRVIRFLQQGFDPIAACKEKKHEVFIDLKGYDIPSEIAEMIRDLERAGVDVITIHTSGGDDMLKAAVDARTTAKLLAITVLTSLSEGQVGRTYGASTAEKIHQFAHEAYVNGFDGTVSSAADLAILHKYTDVGHGDMIRCTPGIRWKDAIVEGDDQARVMEPKDAGVAGAHWLVIRRPIVRAPNPVAAALRAETEFAEGIALAA